MKISEISYVRLARVIFTKEEYPELFEVAYRNRFTETLKLFVEQHGERVISTMDVEVRAEYVSFRAFIE